MMAICFVKTQFLNEKRGTLLYMEKQMIFDVIIALVTKSYYHNLNVLGLLFIYFFIYYLFLFFIYLFFIYLERKVFCFFKNNL